MKLRTNYPYPQITERERAGEGRERNRVREGVTENEREERGRMTTGKEEGWRKERGGRQGRRRVIEKEAEMSREKGKIGKEM